MSGRGAPNDGGGDRVRCFELSAGHDLSVVRSKLGDQQRRRSIRGVLEENDADTSMVEDETDLGTIRWWSWSAAVAEAVAAAASVSSWKSDQLRGRVDEASAGVDGERWWSLKLLLLLKEDELLTVRHLCSYSCRLRARTVSAYMTVMIMSGT